MYFGLCVLFICSVLVLVNHSSSIFTGPRQMDFSKDEGDTCNFSDLKLPDLSVSNFFCEHSFIYILIFMWCPAVRSLAHNTCVQELCQSAV